MAFHQDPPTLKDPFENDSFLRGYLSRHVAGDAHRAIADDLREVGAIASELYALKQADPKDEPRLVSWDAWGHRIDRIELSALWKKAKRVAAERGVVGTAYERKNGEYSRIHQFALAYLLEGTWDVYSCPLAMTDGAAKTLLVHIAGGESLTLLEVDAIMKQLGKNVPDQTHILFGVAVDAKLGDSVCVTLLSSLGLAQLNTVAAAAPPVDMLPIKDRPMPSIMDNLGGSSAAPAPIPAPAPVSTPAPAQVTAATPAPRSPRRQ